MTTQIGDMLTINGITGKLIKFKDRSTVVLFDGKQNHYVSIDTENNVDGAKVCTDCKQSKSINDFARYKKGTLRNQCAECFSKRIKKGIANSKPKAKEKAAKETVEVIQPMNDPINPIHYPEKYKDLIAKWHDIAPSFEAFAFAMYTHMDKYGFRFLNKNGSEDLDKLIEYATRLREFQLKREQTEPLPDDSNYMPMPELPKEVAN